MSMDSLEAWVAHRAQVNQPQPNWTYTGPYTNHVAALNTRREAEEGDNKEKHEYANILQVWGFVHYRG
jgi:hypothetical protein